MNVYTISPTYFLIVTLPSFVSLYFCNLLFGLFGAIISIRALKKVAQCFV